MIDLAGLVDRVRSDDRFAELGVVMGQFGSVHWVVVDPALHPLAVWRDTPSARRVRALNAVVVSNGPMMGRRTLLGCKVNRTLLVALPGAAGSVLGLATAGTVACLDRHRPRGRSARAPAMIGAAGIALGLAGAAIVASALMCRWVPCGAVRGAAEQIDDHEDFDGEGIDHAWFGRTDGGGRSSAFAAVGMGDGPLPVDIIEGTGGLVRLVRDHQAVTGGDVARLAGRRGTSAWGLVPTSGSGGSQGVVVVIGSAALDVAEAAALLERMGARDAVAADPSACALLAAGGRVLVGPPPWARRRIQRYGLACGVRG